jgi:hypothetical protein
MGRAKSDVVKDQKNENYKKVHVHWRVHVKKGAKNDEELYHDCWLNKWKCNLVDPKQWVEISFVMFFFLARNKTIVDSIVSISATYAFKAKTNIDATNNNSYAM